MKLSRSDGRSCSMLMRSSKLLRHATQLSLAIDSSSSLICTTAQHSQPSRGDNLRLQARGGKLASKHMTCSVVGFTAFSNPPSELMIPWACQIVACIMATDNDTCNALRVDVQGYKLGNNRR